jgi:hypothetical protein
MSKEETPPIIRWLHRRIFRGAGFVFIAGALAETFLFFERWCLARKH